MRKPVKILIFLTLLVAWAQMQRVLLEPVKLKPYMFSEQISGDVTPLKPTKLGRSNLYPLPVESYEIDMKRSFHKFLPGGFPETQIFAYGGKVNGKFQYGYPGPVILALKNTPTYVIWSNNINGTHILPVDRSPPFDMAADFYNEVPAVPHVHGLQTEIGSDGEPMAFWTISGRKGPDYTTLQSAILKKNQAIYRYHNTKEGLFWFHDHAMGITRLNVYAGLVGLYEIVDPNISEEEKNMIRIYGELQRKYLGIVDKSFNTDGSLHYPDKSQSSSFTSWVPEFFGNTITVNGKVWPKMRVQPKKYRFVLLNGCQSRYLKLSFEYNGRKLKFDLFRRDSDYLRRAVTMDQHLLLIGGRVEIVVDFQGVSGDVLVRNTAVTPFPMGNPPDQYTSQVMKIVVEGPSRRNLAQQSQRPKKPSLTSLSSISPKKLPSPASTTILPLSLSPSLYQNYLKFSIIYQITQKMNMYTNYNPVLYSNFDYLDLPQTNGNKVISVEDFIVSNGGIEDYTSSMSNQINNQITTQLNKAAETILQQLTTTVQQTLQNPSPKDLTIKNWPFPKFPEGKPYFTTLVDVNNDEGQLSGVMIDGVPLSAGCQGSVFRQDQVYDLYLINLTMDDHPIHIHLINFQVIGRFKFDTTRYSSDYTKKNGKLTRGGYPKPPSPLDPRPYKTSVIASTPQQQQLFLDIIRVPAGQVTIARMKISNHEGNRFPFQVRGTRYVWHCHILEHQDNQMMRYYCIQ